VKWRKTEIDPSLVKEFAQRYGCDLLAASILIRRGITEGEDARFFLETDLRHLHNPFLLPGMEDAVERLLAAKEEGEKILVYGDRDVDGMTGTALLTGFLRRAGFDANWALPRQGEPYGLSVRAVEEFAAAYGTLVITVDCGISNRVEVARASELGVSVIVTDHHTPPENLPEAAALVNPKLPGSLYPFKELSGCGVAAKLVSALRFALSSEMYGQPISLLNVRPSNDAFIVEIAKTRNLAVIDTLTEALVPGMVDISATRLPAFLRGQQILAWDAPLQKKMLARVFGNGVDIELLDIAGEAGKIIPAAAGKSLVRLRELSRIGKYSGQTGELDVLVNLFTSFVRKKEPAAFWGEGSDEEAQLAALGTIADIMPLLNENRLIVRTGLDALRKKPGTGLAELILALGFDPRHAAAKEVSFQLTPAINAAGRMGSPEKAVSLLLEEDAARRRSLASDITVMNQERKRLVEEVCQRALPEAGKSLDEYSKNLVVVSGENILPGIAGLIASRLADRFHVPALVCSINGDDIKGSLRSARGYDLLPLLERCSDLFSNYGGHPFAAGFDMDRGGLDALCSRLQDIACGMELPGEEDKAWEIDAELPLSYLSMLDTSGASSAKQELYILRLVDDFEPAGERWRPLLFRSNGLVISDMQLMGRDEAKHVKLTLDTGKNPPRDFRWTGLYWNAAGKIKVDFDMNDTVDIIYNLGRDWFNGNEKPQMIIRDLKRHE
jgi:single-stranded-DNA-specific exonuclease